MTESIDSPSAPTDQTPDSTVVAEIRLVHPDLVLTPTIERQPKMITELEYQTIVPPETYYLFFKAYGGDFDRFDALIAEDWTVSEPSVIIDGGDFRVYRMRLTSAERLVLPNAAEMGMRVLHAKSGEGGWIATLQVPEMDSFHQFRQFCADKDVEFSVKRLYYADEDGADHEFGLTRTQRETLLAAYERGYFNDPRDATVADLADALDVSTSAISGRLRRGMRALVANTIGRSTDRD